LEKQDKRNLEYYEKLNQELVKVQKNNEESIKNTERFKQLLDRWKKQADRLDKILSQIENKH